jgi:hypothetical protein
VLLQSYNNSLYMASQFCVFFFYSCRYKEA